MTKQKQTWKQRATFLGKVAISCGLVAWILTKVPATEILAQMRTASPLWIGFALLSNYASIALFSWRWKLLLGQPNVRVRELMGWSLVSVGAGMFLPSSVAADGVKAVLYGQSSKNLGRSLLSTVFGKIFGIIAIVVHVLVGIALWPEARSLVSTSKLTWLLTAMAVVLIGSALLLPALLRQLRGSRFRHSAWGSRAERAFHYANETRKDIPRLAMSLLLSIGGQTFGFLSVWLLFIAIHSPVAFGPLFALLPVVALGSLAPISIGGIGVREGVMISLFLHFHIATAQQCLATSLIGYMIVGILGLTGAVWWLLRKQAS